MAKERKPYIINFDKEKSFNAFCETMEKAKLLGDAMLEEKNLELHEELYNKFKTKVQDAAEHAKNAGIDNIGKVDDSNAVRIYNSLKKHIV